MGPRHLPVKGSTHASRSSASATQVRALLERINEQDQKISKQNEQIAALTFAYVVVHKLMETLLGSKGTRNVNICTPHDTECPIVVRARSSIASRLGENSLTNEDEHPADVEGDHCRSS